jgi:hypothetical protein
VELAECQQTTCGVCSSCIAQMLLFTQQFATGAAGATANASLVAERWRAFCASSTTYSASTCESIRGQAAASYAGSLGKQAGKLCHLLGSCSGAIATDASCPISTRLLSGQQVRQSLDWCRMEGVSGGSRVPGLSASAALAPGRCFNSSDCKSESLECSMDAGAVTIYTCDSTTGLLSSTTQGTCVKTACQVCNECMAAAQPFALKQATSSNATQIAEDWSAYCQSSGLASSTQCAAVAGTIRTAGAVPGNLGKRAAGLCFTLGLCNATRCSSSGPLDLCTVQGLAGGMLVPGISATTAVPLGRCFSAADCTLPADTCDKSVASKPAKLCTCSNGVESCGTDLLGSCTIASGGCQDCKLCLAAVQPFVRDVLQDNGKAATWGTFCTTNKLGTTASCAGVGTSFGSDVNRFRRAGLLCGALQRCTPNTAADPTCVPTGIVLVSGTTTGTDARFDSCMVEGVAGGRVLPGISPTKTLPAGSCQNDLQCGNPDLRCDTSNTTSFCYCEGGTDFCLSVGACKRTPCAVCNDCLDAANRLTESIKFVTTAPAVADAVTAWCGRQVGADAAKCASVNASILAPGGMNSGKRAGLLCQRLGACDTTTLPATCKLTSRRAVEGALVVAKSGVMVSLGGRSRLCCCFCQGSMMLMTGLAWVVFTKAELCAAKMMHLSDTPYAWCWCASRQPSIFLSPMSQDSLSLYCADPYPNE